MKLKRKKIIAKLLAKKILKAREAFQLARLTGWRHDPNDDGGSSHQQFIRNPGEGKATIPAHDEDIDIKVTRNIKKQLGLL